jgi:hypothetical protein
VIVLAIAPGIRKLSYAILDVRHDQLRATIIDSDVLHHTARHFSFRSFADMLDRARVHWLILSTCLDRNEPAIIALGPPADKRENRDYIEACCRMLRTAALTLSIPIYEYSSEEEIQTELGLRARCLLTATKQVVSPTSLPRCVLIASSAGIAAAAQMLELPTDVFSRETKLYPKSLSK